MRSEPPRCTRSRAWSGATVARRGTVGGRRGRPDRGRRGARPRARGPSMCGRRIWPRWPPRGRCAMPIRGCSSRRWSTAGRTPAPRARRVSDGGPAAAEATARRNGAHDVRVSFPHADPVAPVRVRVEVDDPIVVRGTARSRRRLPPKPSSRRRVPTGCGGGGGAVQRPARPTARASRCGPTSRRRSIAWPRPRAADGVVNAPRCV